MTSRDIERISQGVYTIHFDNHFSDLRKCNVNIKAMHQKVENFNEILVECDDECDTSKPIRIYSGSDNRDYSTVSTVGWVIAAMTDN